MDLKEGCIQKMRFTDLQVEDPSKNTFDGTHLLLTRSPVLNYPYVGLELVPA